MRMRMMRKRKGKRDYLALPDEVVAETILWRLPIKSILQCRCVCKSWNSLITSSNFVSTHFLRKTKSLTLNPQILLNQRWKIHCCCLIFDYENYLLSMSFRLPHHLYKKGDIKIVGSVNGLICFFINEPFTVHNIIICNPSIGKFQSIGLPNSSSPVKTSAIKGFGFDETTQDYKILIINSYKDVFIYSLNLNCWRMITFDVPKRWVMNLLSSLLYSNFHWYDRYSVVFVNGNFNWLAFLPGESPKKWLIMVFDVKSESFGHILLPNSLQNSRHYNLFELMEFGESSISILDHQCNDIWIMKEYGSVKSWMKLVTLAPGKKLGGFINKYELFYRTSSHMASQKINYDRLELADEVKKMTIEDVAEMTYVHYDGLDSFGIHKYVPSLVLLDKENNIDVAPPTHTTQIKTFQRPSSRTRKAQRFVSSILRQFFAIFKKRSQA